MGKISKKLNSVVKATEKTAGVFGLGWVAGILTQGALMEFTNDITDNMDDGAMKTGIKVGGYIIATVCGIGAGWATLDIVDNQLNKCPEDIFE